MFIIPIFYDNIVVNMYVNMCKLISISHNRVSKYCGNYNVNKYKIYTKLLNYHQNMHDRDRVKISDEDLLKRYALSKNALGDEYYIRKIMKYEENLIQLIDKYSIIFCSNNSNFRRYPEICSEITSENRSYEPAFTQLKIFIMITKT